MALVVTVVVLIILATVSIGMMFGDNGLVSKAEKSREYFLNDTKYTESSMTNIDKNINDIIKTTSGDLIVADGSWDGKVNAPKLTNGMTAIAWDNSNNEFKPKTNDEWYNYEEGKWANAKTEDGSYWVWIPRFEYKINDTTGGDYTKAGEIYVRFIDTNTKAGTEGYSTEEGITRSSDDYIIHPAFTDGEGKFDNGEWDSELSGFWVSKYKMSQVDSKGNNVKTTSTEIGNVGLSDNVKMVSKPGMSIWSNINVANCYTNSFKYDRNRESHLIKNSEWGALAYLTHSKYGRNGVQVSTNTIGVAGGGEGDTYKNQVSQNSTGNITGIYDINGGNFHKMAVFNSSYSGRIFDDKDSRDVEGNHFAKTGGKSTKYATAYSNSTDTVNGDYTVGDVSKIGDATEELWTSGQYSWFNDYAHFVFMGNPFLHRGGVGGWGDVDGIFSSVSNNGSCTGNDSFRVVLCI